jgi:hypothetical protein
MVQRCLRHRDRHTESDTALTELDPENATVG